MQGFWWKLPVLRGLSPLTRGLIETGGATIVIALLALPLVHAYASSPSGTLLSNIAQIGATLLVAYGIEVSWFLRESRSRGADRQNWVGVIAGLGCAGLLGIALALVLSGIEDSLTILQEFVFSYSVVSISLLGLLVALGPLMTYEWAHEVHAEYPDE